MDTDTIKIEGAVQKESGIPFTQEEREGFYERFLEFIDGEKSLYFGGNVT